MSYEASDPRSSLSSKPTPAAKANAAPEYFDFSDLQPDEVSELGSRTWWIRGQNFVLAYTLAIRGEEFRRSAQPDEYMLYLPSPDGRSTVVADSGSSDVDQSAVVVVPPGASSVTVHDDLPLVRFFSSRSVDLLGSTRNHTSYDRPHANVALFEPWPTAAAGEAVRVYAVKDHPYVDGRFGRIFRCSTFMINVFDPSGPRDPAALSPHHHDDFEQCSLAVAGEYVHHIRSPWTTDLTEWRDDEHVRVASPSVAVIPPPTVHTSQAISPGTNQLIDIFCPPRHDFSAQEGWVINADEYPLPPAEPST